jgi:tRNA pseudouridine55 synthase
MIVGIIKPKGPTSHDMIYEVRRITHIKRVGHAGTLDPSASGVLVVAIGRESTKQLTDLINHDKEYVATVTLGSTSTTDDGEGIITDLEFKNCDLGIEKVQKVIESFVGTIMQVPPIYSAIKMGGKKAYEFARKGTEIVMVPREVIIHAIEIESYKWPKLIIKVHCGKGVYIRSLARDIGTALKTGGYMSALSRIRVGDYLIEKSMTIPEFEKYWREHLE